MFNCKGKVTEILQAETGTSAKGAWSKQNIIVQVESGQYPKSICFTLFNKTDVIQSLYVGAEVNVSFSIECKEWNDKWFNNVSAFKVEKVSNALPPSIPEKQRQATRDKAQAQVHPSVSEENSADLPF